MNGRVYQLKTAEDTANAVELTPEEREFVAVYVDAKRALTRAESVMEPMEDAVRKLVRRCGGSVRLNNATLIVEPKVTGFEFGPEVQALAAALKKAQKTEKDLKTAVPKTTLSLKWTDHALLPPVEELEAEAAAQEAADQAEAVQSGPGRMERVRGVLRRILRMEETESGDETRG